MLFKSILLIFTALVLVAVNIAVLLLNPIKESVHNDDDEYIMFYKKWVCVVCFMTTIILALVSLYFSVYSKHFFGAFFLCTECVFVIIYTLCKSKLITIKDDEITVERLFRKDIKTKFSSISKVMYSPNVKMTIKLKNKNSFEVSFNSVNYHRFYEDLINRNVSFKTMRVTSDSNKVYLTKYNITVHFPKTMFREYYQSKTFFRNSKYLFSARSLDNHEYIEGYRKESEKGFDDFIELVKNDLKINGFTLSKEYNEKFDGFDFVLIDATCDNDKELGRTAYVYQDTDNYFIIYATYVLSNKDKFLEKMQKAITRSTYEDGKNTIVRV